MIYNTVQGDKWDSIAYKLYGDVRYTDIIIGANPAYRKVFIFSAGITLNIPEIETRITADSLPPWKRTNG